LRDRTEGALPTDAHFVPPFDLALDFAFHRQARLIGFHELPVYRRSARELTCERQAPGRRDDHGVDSVADSELECSIVVLQLAQIDDRFALATDVYERDVMTKADDRPFDGLASFEVLRLERSLEHRGKVIFTIGHRRASPYHRPARLSRAG